MRGYINKKRQNLWSDVVIGILWAVIVLGIQQLIQYFFKWDMNTLLSIHVDESLCVSVITTQYTITFLIISLLSLLSGRGEYVYWVDVLEQKVISPKHLNFISMSVYAFISMIAGTIAFVNSETDLVLIFFVIDVTILIFLTFRMTSVFFGQDRLRRGLYSEIETEVKKYLEEPQEETLRGISAKLNGIYENAAKLAEMKEFGQILNTDFSLLIDLSELMKEKYDNELAKLLYGNITKMLLMFEESGDYILNNLNDKYRPFANEELQSHTIEMIQSALSSYFERVLAAGQYRSSQDFWITGIYQNMQKTYLFMLKQANSTAAVSDTRYYDYEGEIMLHHEKTINGIDNVWELVHLQYKLIHHKLFRFTQLIYQNSPDLLFEIVAEHGMPIDIMWELDLLGCICEHDKLLGSRLVCRKIVEKLYVFKLNDYIDTYSDYDMTSRISRANKDEQYYAALVQDINRTAYNISETFIELVRVAAFVKASPKITYELLHEMYQNIGNIVKTLGAEKDKYPVLVNKDTEEALLYRVKLNDETFREMLENICETYATEKELVAMAKRILELFNSETNLFTYYNMFWGVRTRGNDIRNEWVWGIDQAARDGEIPEEFL